MGGGLESRTVHTTHTATFKTTLVTYLLTPRCRVLLEKLTGLQPVKIFPEFHGTRRFITALTSVRHLSLSSASPIQSINPHPTSWRSILILSTHLRLGLPVVSFLPVSPAVYEIRWKNIVEPDRPQITIWRMRIACWMPKATNIRSEYVIFIAFALHQEMYERAWTLYSTYTACLVIVVWITATQEKRIIYVQFKGRDYLQWHLNKLKPKLLLNTQSAPRSKHFVSVIQTSQLMLYKEIIAVCSQIHIKHITQITLKYPVRTAQ